MRLEGVKVVLTGAAGGIGAEVARGLVGKGAAVALLDYNAEALEALAARLGGNGATVYPITVDLLDEASRSAALERASTLLGQVDLLVNVAGLISFRPFAEEDPVVLQRIAQLNLVVPMLIARALLPEMVARGSGRIVNIGSIFGSIGFAWYTAYSASKFGLRGFSEALRRELADSGIGVTYIAPRAVRTPLNDERVTRMAKRVGMNMDSPEWVAERIVEAIEGEKKEVYLGWPESLFVRINALLPRLVDMATRKQNQIAAAFARER